MGRRQHLGERRPAVSTAPQSASANLQPAHQRLRPRVLHLHRRHYAPFYSTPIECTDRDAPTVLDGLLYNESDLELEEHYTDTHGYTEINFAAFAMLGRRFRPRIRNIKRQHIYRLDDRDYGPLASLVSHVNRKIDMQPLVEQWDRIGHFFAPLESGHRTASVALRRLAGFSAKNRFYRATRDLGRLLKTEYILDYMSKPELRPVSAEGCSRSSRCTVSGERSSSAIEARSTLASR